MTRSASQSSSLDKAIECTQVWSKVPNTLALLAVSSIAMELEAVGDQIPAPSLCSTLCWPIDTRELITELASFAKCRHVHPLRADRMSQLVNQLQSKKFDGRTIAGEVQKVAAASWRAKDGSSTDAIPISTRAAGAAPPRPKMQPAACQSLHEATDLGTTLPAGNAHTPTRKSQSRSTKKGLQADENTFADLWAKHRPVDPKELHAQLQEAKQDPASTGNVQTVEFKPSQFGTKQYSEREGRWLFWQELGRIGVFVRELYMGTKNWQFSNADAGPGSKGQCVVFSEQGTILWMSTGRVYRPQWRRRAGCTTEDCIPTVDGRHTF